jgi:hypothetical protein
VFDMPGFGVNRTDRIFVSKLQVLPASPDRFFGPSASLKDLVLSASGE